MNQCLETVKPYASSGSPAVDLIDTGQARIQEFSSGGGGGPTFRKILTSKKKKKTEREGGGVASVSFLL